MLRQSLSFIILKSNNMKWITTYEPANMPHRFPDRQAEESDYLCFGLMSTHLWKYSSEKKHLLHSTGTKTECVSDTELLRLYCNKHWKIKPFFVLRDYYKRQKAPRRCLLNDVPISGAYLSFRFSLLWENAAEPQIISCDRERGGKQGCQTIEYAREPSSPGAGVQGIYLSSYLR